MKEFKTLIFLDRFKSVFEKFNIDYKVMRRILQIKLTMDNRRSYTVMSNITDEETDNSFKKTLLGYGIFGIFIGITMVTPFNTMFKMSMVFGMIIFILMTAMLSDFSVVLLDMRDKNVLTSKPIDVRTINAAKILHICIYMCSITLVVSALSIVVGVFRYGILFGMAFIIQLLFILGFTVFLTSIFYFIIIMCFDGEKVRDIINYFQITFSIVLMIGYQFTGKIFSMFTPSISFVPKWWHYLVPPVWFAAPMGLIIDKSLNKYYIYLSIISIIVPILLFIFYFKFIVPYFEKNLQKLNNISNKKNINAENKEKFRVKINSVFTKNKKENAFVRFSQNVMSNERNFKLRLYPSLAFAVFMPFLIMFRDVMDSKVPKGNFSSLCTGREHLVMYISIVLFSQSVLFIRNSSSCKGAWIYRIVPLENPSLIYKGALKGLILRYILPLYLFISFMFLIMCGKRIILDLILMLLNLMLLIAIGFKVSKKKLPFSCEFKKNEEGGFQLIMVNLIVTGVLGFLHFLLWKISYGVAALSIAILIVNIILWKKTFKLSWKQALKQ